MSEYQYYEFQAIDRRLEEREMRELRAYSSRAKITPACFVNEYSFGDFKGDANVWMEKFWMEKYFEAHVGAELCSRFNRQTAGPAVEQQRRTVGELLAAAGAHAENRRIEQNRKAAIEKGV